MDYSIEKIALLEKYVFSDNKVEVENLLSQAVDKLTLAGEAEFGSTARAGPTDASSIALQACAPYKPATCRQQIPW